MKNIDRQKYLDIEKYFASQTYQRDTSGMMYYCTDCDYRNKPHNECTISHEERVEKCACAKAFNKLQKCKRLH